MRLLSFILLVAIAGMAAPFCRADTLNVGMDPWAGEIPLNVAAAKGFWKKRGLDVHVKVFDGAEESTAALTGGQIDVCYEMVGSWITRSLRSHTPVVLLGENVWSNGGDKIIVKRGVDIKDLKGQPIGLYSSSLALELFLHHFLLENQLQRSDFEIVVVPDETLLVDDFISGRFQVILDYDPSALQALSDGEGEAAASTATYPGCMPEGFAMRQDRFTKVNPATLVTFFEGWFDAVDWANDPANWNELKTIINRDTFQGAAYSDVDLHQMIHNVVWQSRENVIRLNQPGGALGPFLVEAGELVHDQLHLDCHPETWLNALALLEAAQQGPAFSLVR
jgi:NitT/TauT family transport system substrate-binding protein